VPKEKYSFGPEIYEHAQRIGRFYDLYSSAYSRPSEAYAWNEAASMGGGRPIGGDVYHTPTTWSCRAAP